MNGIPKQETLEEASLKYNPLKKFDGEFIRAAFINGAKWQAERMYSEEEVKEILMKTDRFLRADLDLWFEQFKKKIIIRQEKQ
jgi:hypothetical protein